MLRLFTGLCSTLRQFKADESGISLLYVTMSMPVIIGFGLLAIDVGRLTSLQSSLQHGADSLALAGAAELDFGVDAITRSERAITNLVTTNTSLFATTAVTIDRAAVSTCYLAELPANDVEPINSANCLDQTIAASNVVARFVQVKVTPVNFNTVFPATFVGAANNTATSSAEAVAGFQAAVCDVTPMFMCNPKEDYAGGTPTNEDFTDATELLDHIANPAERKKQFNMKQTGGNSAQYFPGNFGWLVPEGGDGNSGASNLQDAVGRVNQKGCYVSSGVELRTGSIQSIRFGFNTRFDMYDGSFNSERDNPEFRPGLNNRKGYANDKNGNGQGSACNPDTADREISTDRGYLYKDACFETNSCTGAGGRMGDGNWDKATYWSRSHNGAALPGSISGADVSRYEVYKYELEDLTNRVDNDSNGTGGSNDGGELGGPRCYNGPSGGITATPDRRIFHAAILNCQALDASAEYGPIQGGSSNKLPVAAFGKFFLTEPVSGGGNASNADGDVWAELVDVSVPGQADGIARDIVQLYR
jgi:Flp pilus assembly protein TadG